MRVFHFTEISLVCSLIAGIVKHVVLLGIINVNFPLWMALSSLWSKLLIDLVTKRQKYEEIANHVQLNTIFCGLLTGIVLLYGHLIG